MRSQKTTLITDLDNTLFDWVDLWINCFSAMLDSIAETSGVTKDALIPEIAIIHQRHGTSEYSFLLNELPSLQPLLKERPATEVFADAIEKFRIKRRENLRLFPTVKDTLEEIKSEGARIIGYTESMAFYSNYRIKHLDLDGILDFVFCPEDHVLPNGISTDEIRHYPAEHYKLNSTIQHFTPKGSKKPNVEVLNAIVKDLNLSKEKCVYVGDNLMKDVAMAQSCGIDDVWAKYGQAHKRAEYKLLQQVTHWTPEEVAREQEIKERTHVNPTHTLEAQFSEILKIFEFGVFHE